MTRIFKRGFWGSGGRFLSVCTPFLVCAAMPLGANLDPAPYVQSLKKSVSSVKSVVKPSLLQVAFGVEISLLDPVDIAIAEDIGPGDLTSLFFIPEKRVSGARIFAKEACVVAGLGVVQRIYQKLDP